MSTTPHPTPQHGQPTPRQLVEQAAERWRARQAPIGSEDAALWHEANGFPRLAAINRLTGDQARAVLVDYATRYPGDFDRVVASEQAIAAKVAMTLAGAR